MHQESNKEIYEQIVSKLGSSTELQRALQSKRWKSSPSPFAETFNVNRRLWQFIVLCHGTREPGRVAGASTVNTARLLNTITRERDSSIGKEARSPVDATGNQRLIEEKGSLTASTSESLERVEALERGTVALSRYAFEANERDKNFAVRNSFLLFFYSFTPLRPLRVKKIPLQDSHKGFLWKKASSAQILARHFSQLLLKHSEGCHHSGI